MIDSLMRSMIFSLSLMWLMEGRKKLQDGILPVSAIFSLSGHATACQPWLKIQLCLDLATSQYMCSKYHFRGFKTSARNIRKYLKLWQWERGECNTSYQTCFFLFVFYLYILLVFMCSGFSSFASFLVQQMQHLPFEYWFGHGITMATVEANSTITTY